MWLTSMGSVHTCETTAADSCDTKVEVSSTDDAMVVHHYLCLNMNMFGATNTHKQIAIQLISDDIVDKPFGHDD